MPRRPYPSDLSDAQWRVLEPLIPPPKPGGRPRSADVRAVVDAVLYVARNGATWRALPHDYPPWRTVYHYFRAWRMDGTWERLHDAPRDQTRQAAGRGAQPQRGHHRQPVGEDHGKRGPRGHDAGKKLTGRKRHVLVATEGFLTELVVHAANISESAGARLVLAKAQAAGRALGQIWLDGGYQAGVVAWAEAELGYALEVVARSPGSTGFAVLPRRWVVERSFAWIGRYRRLSNDYEALTATSEAMIWAAVGTTMLRRLAKRGTS